MGRVAPPAEVLRIVAAGDFDRLIGVIEDQHIEFKEQPYLPLDDERRMELAKDVSALANVHEGVIVIGPRTGQPDATRPQDEVVHVSTLKRDLVDPEQYHRTLRSLVFPTLENVSIEWYPSAADRTRGILCIHVPAQPEANRPFLTTKMLTENNRLSERSFGLFQRRRANADSVSVYEVHGWLRAGRGRVDAPAANLPPAPAAGGPAPDAVGVPTGRRLTDALEAVQRFDQPTITFAAMPSRSLNFRGFLDSQSAPANDIESPPTLRQHGFDLDTGGTVQLVEGHVRRAVTPNYKLLEVWRDGFVQFIAPGDTDFLAWGRGDQQGQSFRINPLVLAEAALMFATFVDRVYQHAERQPERITYHIHLRHAVDGQGRRSRLVPYALGTARWMTQDAREAPGENHSVQVDVPRNTPPAEAAYLLLQEFYGWFGVNADALPYVVTQDGHRVVSADLIRTAGG
jgi:hypothetical protein